MKTQFISLSQARCLGRSLLAYAAEACGQCVTLPPTSHPREPVREQDGGGGQTLSSRMAPYMLNRNMPLPMLQLPLSPCGKYSENSCIALVDSGTLCLLCPRASHLPSFCQPHLSPGTYFISAPIVTKWKSHFSDFKINHLQRNPKLKGLKPES